MPQDWAGVGGQLSQWSCPPPHSIRKSLMAWVQEFPPLPQESTVFFLLHFPSQSQSSRVLWEVFSVSPAVAQAFVLREEGCRGDLVPFPSRSCLLFQACASEGDFNQPPALIQVFLVSAWWRPKETRWQVGAKFLQVFTPRSSLPLH